jgi:hypothetical protein
VPPPAELDDERFERDQEWIEQRDREDRRMEGER